MDRSALLALAESWIDAFNKQDLDKLLSLYHTNAYHYSPKLKIRHPETKGVIQGKDALSTWWKEAFDRLPSLHYELLRFTIGENRVFLEYVRQVKGEEDLTVGELLEFDKGLIQTSRVYHS